MIFSKGRSHGNQSVNIANSIFSINPRHIARTYFKHTSAAWDTGELAKMLSLLRYTWFFSTLQSAVCTMIFSMCWFLSSWFNIWCQVRTCFNLQVSLLTPENCIAYHPKKNLRKLWAWSSMIYLLLFWVVCPINPLELLLLWLLCPNLFLPVLNSFPFIESHLACPYVSVIGLSYCGIFGWSFVVSDNFLTLNKLKLWA